MQLYNTLSAEERAIMIDDAGKKDLLCRSMLTQIQDQHNFERFIPRLGSASGSWSIYMCQRRN
jgi:hypothetical protein